MSINTVSAVRMDRVCKNRAFTVTELLVSVVLMATLLGITSLSISGAGQSYDQQNITSQMDQSSRNILERMKREIRSAANVSCLTNILIITPSADTNDKIAYVLANGVLKYHRIHDGVDSASVMLGQNDDVTVKQFEITVVKDMINGKMTATFVTVSLACEIKGQTRNLIASACPRQTRLLQKTEEDDEDQDVNEWWDRD